MKTKFTYSLILLLNLIVGSACKNTNEKPMDMENTSTSTTTPISPNPPPSPAPTEIPNPVSIVVTQQGDIFLSGKKTGIENLKTELEKELLTLTSIPDKIPIKTKGEVLMGMRQEVETQINEAINAVKEAKKK